MGDGDTIHSFIHSLPPEHTLFYTRAISAGGSNARVGRDPGSDMKNSSSEIIRDLEHKPKQIDR